MTKDLSAGPDTARANPSGMPPAGVVKLAEPVVPEPLREVEEIVLYLPRQFQVASLTTRPDGAIVIKPRPQKRRRAVAVCDIMVKLAERDEPLVAALQVRRSDGMTFVRRIP